MNRIHSGNTTAARAINPAVEQLVLRGEHLKTRVRVSLASTKKSARARALLYTSNEFLATSVAYSGKMPRKMPGFLLPNALSSLFPRGSWEVGFLGYLILELFLGVRLSSLLFLLARCVVTAMLAWELFGLQCFVAIWYEIFLHVSKCFAFLGAIPTSVVFELVIGRKLLRLYANIFYTPLGKYGKLLYRS